MSKTIKISLIAALSCLSIFCQAQTAPEFKLLDNNGKMLALSDYKGKIVYLDFWASWCGPCVKEIPASKRLQEAFKDNPFIAFITISLDHDTLQWKKMLQSKKMSGIQLISPKGNESNVITNYNVQTIPRTYIIDKNGMILDQDAALPSDKALYKRLEKLTKE